MNTSLSTHADLESLGIILLAPVNLRFESGDPLRNSIGLRAAKTLLSLRSRQRRLRSAGSYDSPAGASKRKQPAPPTAFAPPPGSAGNRIGWVPGPVLVLFRSWPSRQLPWSNPFVIRSTPIHGFQQHTYIQEPSTRIYEGRPSPLRRPDGNLISTSRRCDASMPRNTSDRGQGRPHNRIWSTCLQHLNDIGGAHHFIAASTCASS